ncbi:isochorismatase family protein [Sphingomonas profundi]|uniref:isochorismatase family protein n=1 Tax=Alterirhizorhabdus profundi TaxID=2681549 RepID=UPI0012E7D530|nr:isochorismatase family protein [Sphingomonas profundi]
MTQPVLTLDPARTAMLIVDIQDFTVALPTAPLSGPMVLDNAVRLAGAARAAGVLVILVRVGHPDNAVPQLSPIADATFAGSGTFAADRDIPAILGPEPGDIVIDKLGWGSFPGTGLDAVLRRRGIDTIVIAGLTTHIAVDTTMREAHALGYDQVLASDAVSAFTAAEHDHVLTSIAPRISRVRTTDQIVAALGG